MINDDYDCTIIREIQAPQSLPTTNDVLMIIIKWGVNPYKSCIFHDNLSQNFGTLAFSILVYLLMRLIT